MILHVDMDAFYASVEQRDNPQLRGHPVAVGGSADGRGVVAAASYEARVFGVRSAMAMRSAIRLCPELRIVKPRIGHYAAISKQIREIFEEYTPIIEPLSLDEAYLDVTHTAHLFGNAKQIGIEIKEKTLSKLGLKASVGIGPGKLVAKIASDLRKPDALVVVLPEELNAFLAPLPIERVSGIGDVTSRQFHKIGIRTLGDLRRLTPDDLKHIVGNNATRYWELARGIDNRPVVPYRESKSISSERTFPQDIDDTEVLYANLMLLVEGVARRLRSYGWYGKGVDIKIKYDDFQVLTRSMMLPLPTDVTSDFLAAASSLFREKTPQGNRPVRLIGFGIHHLRHETYEQLNLFDQEEKAKQKALDKVTDTIANKFGRLAIRRGTSPNT